MQVDDSGALRQSELDRMADVLRAHDYSVVAPGTETITIPRAEFDLLKDDEKTLQLLNNAGVDNWEWYGEALNHPEDYE
ncbi:hypothetical protein OG474_09745 [Kribbella sp. NBC_01505]|uniref:hypothetical protein n=1 Tax=Kribbella sp. NBC_01505 TaxID=2903580 RepID=UPI00386B81CA